MKIRLYVGMLVATISIVAFADEGSIVVAADSSSGTYNKMLGEIIAHCPSDTFNIVPAQGVKGGAPGNLEALVNNKVQAAFMHSDVFLANSMADPSMNRFKTLVALYPEPVHVLMLRESKTSKKGSFSFGKQEFNSLGDVAGYKVGAAGGGVFTSRILQGQGQGGFEVVPFDTGDQVIAALNTGEIAAAIFVGAAPLPNLEKLDPAKYKLVPIGENIASKVASVYRTVTINYRTMTNGPMKTLAPLAVIMTRTYSTQAKVQAQAHFRQCFNEALPSLKDDGAPNWQDVEANDHGTLNNWYDLPIITNKR